MSNLYKLCLLNQAITIYILIFTKLYIKITYFIEFFLHNLINLKTEESKCVVNLSQSINNTKGVGESKISHDRIVYTCS